MDLCLRVVSGVSRPQQHDVIDLQLRAEAYNVFNTPQFSNVDTDPKFDAQGNQVNSDFGRVTAARDPRIMQFALRVSF